VVICLERGADLHMAQPVPLPLTVSCSSKIQIGFTFLVPAHLGSPGQRAVKRVCMAISFSGNKQDAAHKTIFHANYGDITTALRHCHRVCARRSARYRSVTVTESNASLAALRRHCCTHPALTDSSHYAYLLAS